MRFFKRFKRLVFSFEKILNMGAGLRGYNISKIELGKLAPPPPHKSVCQPSICQPLTAVITLGYIHRLWNFWSSRSVVLPGFKSSRVHSEQYWEFKQTVRYFCVLRTDMQSVVIEIFTVDILVPSTVEVYSRLYSTFSAEMFLQSGPECYGE